MKKQFTIFIIFVSFIAALLMTGGVIANHYIKERLENSLIAVYASEEQTIGNELGQSITDRFTTIQNSLDAIALDPSIQSTNPALCNPALQKYYNALNLGVGNLGRVNTDGVFYCTVNKSLLNKPASSLGTYVHQLFIDPSHDAVVSPEFKIPGQSGYAVALHVPVYDSQYHFMGSIGGAVYLDQLSKSLLSKVKFAQTGYASVQDDEGNIIYSHRPTYIGKNFFSNAIQGQANVQFGSLNKAILAARQGKTTTVTYVSHNITKIATVVPVTIVPNNRWILLVNVPKSEIAQTFIHSGLNEAFNTVLIGLGIVLVVLFSLLSIMTYNSYKLQLAKDQFISLVSHQLRTPLTAIRQFSEMLADPAVGSLNQLQKEYVETVHLSTIRMIDLVGDILNVSRIELNRLKVEPALTDVSAFVLSKIEEVKPLADDKKIKIIVHNPVHAISSNIDQTLYGQIVHNLLTNAIRYSDDERGVVNVTIKRTKGGGCELIVEDNGIGIPRNAQRKIFKLFYRADNAIRSVGEGTGLGLYLVKMIITSTGGSVWFKSTEKKGTTFHVTIPATGMISSKKKSK
jgi:signal transduction histidine kinase